MKSRFKDSLDENWEMKEKRLTSLEWKKIEERRKQLWKKLRLSASLCPVPRSSLRQFLSLRENEKRTQTSLWMETARQKVFCHQTKGNASSNERLSAFFLLDSLFNESAFESRVFSS